MKISRFVKGAAVLAVLAVAVVGAGLGAKSADAQSAYVSANGPYSGVVGSPVTFSASVSPAFGGITAATWTFSDGIALNGLSVSRVFNGVGPYTATITVRNTFGAVQSAVGYVTIVGVSPVVTTTFAGPLQCGVTDSSVARVQCAGGAIVHGAYGYGTTNLFPTFSGSCLYGVVVIGGQIVCSTGAGTIRPVTTIAANCINGVVRTPAGYEPCFPGLR